MSDLEKSLKSIGESCKDLGKSLEKNSLQMENVRLKAQISEMQSHIDCLKAELEEVQNANRKLREKWKNLGLRCHDSARDLFEKDLCGCLHIVTADELKRNAHDLPSEPIKVADMLIHETYTVKKGDIEKSICRAFGNTSDISTYNVYSVSDLREIAEHLLAYCNNNEEK